MAGALFLIGATLFLLGLVVAEALYPGYNLADNYISDLGVGPSSAVFNTSVFLLGALVLAGVFYLRNSHCFGKVNAFLLLMAVSSMGVGVFTKDFTIAHGIVSLAAFLFSALAAVTSSKLFATPFSLLSGILGVITLGALLLFSIGMVSSGSITSTEANDSAYYFGLGPGGMERLIVYPVLMWVAAFGGHLMARGEAPVAPQTGNPEAPESGKHTMIEVRASEHAPLRKLN